MYFLKPFFTFFQIFFVDSSKEATLTYNSPQLVQKIADERQIFVFLYVVCFPKVLF